ncbi:hypothetical protein LXL04_034182 [Taraxacum kok-saghyz]
MILYNTYLKGFVKKNLKKNTKKVAHMQKIKKSCTYAKIKKNCFFGIFFATGLVFERFLAPEVGFSKKLMPKPPSILTIHFLYFIINGLDNTHNNISLGLGKRFIRICPPATAFFPAREHAADHHHTAETRFSITTYALQNLPLFQMAPYESNNTNIGLIVLLPESSMPSQTSDEVQNVGHSSTKSSLMSTPRVVNALKKREAAFRADLWAAIKSVMKGLKFITFWLADKQNVLMQENKENEKLVCCGMRQLVQGVPKAVIGNFLSGLRSKRPSDKSFRSWTPAHQELISVKAMGSSESKAYSDQSQRHTLIRVKGIG